MATVSLSITDDLGRIVSRIDTAIAGVDDFRPMWRRIAPAWEARGRDMFRTQGRSTGSRWPQYSETAEGEWYQYYKWGIIGGRLEALRPLTWSPNRERLRPSLTNLRHPLAIYDARRRTLEVGTAAPGAAENNAGRGRAPERMGGHAIPRRTLLRFDRPFVLAVAEASREHALTAERAIDPRAGRGGRGVGLSSRDVNALLGAT